MQTFLSSYKISNEEKYNIINIFESYVRAIVKHEEVTNGIVNLNENKIRIFINKFKNELNKLLNGHMHENLLQYIKINKISEISFDSEDEEKMYDEILKGTFNVEVYCLCYSNYDKMCSILLAIANRLGLYEKLKKKNKVINTYFDNDNTFTRLIKAIKDVE